MSGDDGTTHAAGGPKRVARKDKLRRTHQATLVEFITAAVRLFPKSNIDGSKGVRARALFAQFFAQRGVWTNVSRTEIICYLKGDGADINFAIRLALHTAWSSHQLMFIRAFTRVFDRDIASAPWMGRDVEAWEALGQTRMSRVIARLAGFRPGFFARCLRTMEGARELTYEGEPFATRLLVTSEITGLPHLAGERYRPLNARIPLDVAILSEKWVRAFTSQGTIALVATPRRSTVAGVVIVPDTHGSSSDGLHASIAQVERFVTKGVAMIAATQNGDIWVRLTNGMAFLRRRSRWQYFDLESVGAILAPHISTPVAQALMRLALDASFDRRGALFGILPDPSAIKEVVPDAAKRSRSNRGLRQLVAGLDVTDPLHHPVVRSAAMIDGAILFDADGHVLDAACMAVEPSRTRRAELGVTKWPSFPGARTTAARNISAHGVAIKVSDDGPISIFIGGALRLEIG